MIPEDSQLDPDLIFEDPAPQPPAEPKAPRPPHQSGHAAFGDFTQSPYDYDDLFARGKALRAEAELFVAWCGYLGESTAAATWGTTQQNYAAAWRIRYRALAAKFKSDGPPRPEFMNHIFAEPTALTQQARQELGL